MTDLIACVSSGKGTWGHVQRLINEQDWGKIVLITDEFGKENFKAEKKAEYILIDPNQFLPDLIEDIHKKLENRLTGTEVAINFISGSGKEHMAILSAILKLGMGIRLVALTKEGIKEV